MKNIQNIIFDYGGVIINLDPEAPLQLMHSHTNANPYIAWKVMKNCNLFELYEKGIIDDDEFRNAVRNFFNTNISDIVVDEIWNSMLLDMPKYRIEMLKKCRNNYNIFLLSNSNSIHYRHYLAQLENTFRYKSFDEIFVKAYFSFEIKKIKPDAEIFQFIIDQHNIIPENTLFIDDTLMHVHGASQLNFKTHWLKKDVIELFDENGILRES